MDGVSMWLEGFVYKHEYKWGSGKESVLGSVYSLANLHMHTYALSLSTSVLHFSPSLPGLTHKSRHNNCVQIAFYSEQKWQLILLHFSWRAGIFTLLTQITHLSHFVVFICLSWSKSERTRHFEGVDKSMRNVLSFISACLLFSLFFNSTFCEGKCR